jgi:hypothetical protein
MRGEDTPRTNAAVKKADVVRDYTVLIDEACAMERALSEVSQQVANWESFARALTGSNAKDHGMLRAAIEGEYHASHERADIAFERLAATTKTEAA